MLSFVTKITKSEIMKNLYTLYMCKNKIGETQMAFGQNYLNWYLNQANYGMCGSSMGMGDCHYSIGAQMGIMLAEGVLGRLLGGGMGGFGTCYNTPMGFGGGYSIGGGYPSGGTNAGASPSSIDNEIKSLKSKQSNAEAEVDKAQPELKQNITNAENNLSKFQKLRSTYDSAKSTLESAQSALKAAAEPGEDASDAEKTNYEKLKKAVEDAKKALDKAETALTSAGFNTNTTEEELEAKVTDAKSAREEAIKTYKADIDTKIKALEDKKAEMEAHPDNIDDILNEGDGNWYQRTKKSTSGQMRSALREFRLALKEYDDCKQNNTDGKNAAKNKMQAAAKKLFQTYNNASNNDIKDMSPSLEAGYKQAIAYCDYNKIEYRI